MANDFTRQRSAAEALPADLADGLERLRPEAAHAVLSQMTAAEAAQVLIELEVERATRLLERSSPDQIAAWVEALAPNAAADLVARLAPERRREVLAGLPLAVASAVSALLRHPPDSAGGIMDDRFLSVRAEQTLAEGLDRLRTSPPRKSADVAYIYVTDEAGRLVGVVGVRDLLFAAPDRRVHEIMDPQVHHLRVTDDQEAITRQIERYRYSALPVVDARQRLVGVVRITDALRVAEAEATEDMQLMVGMSGEEQVHTRWSAAIGKRLPWLGVNLGAALLAATVVSRFEDTIGRWTALVVFLPLISAVAGNAGVQALTVIIRGLALGDVVRGDAARVLRKELAIGLVNGVGLGLALGLIGYLWKGSLVLGIVAGAAMGLNQVVGVLSGVLVPFGLRYCKIDPAMASSIFVTTLTDILGFLVFLGLAAFALRAFGL
ncbi:MAG TPA: magnesium transporter [Candidatus Paceibacterota bacterium]|nr:magnesium transporter [Candidatus Paceibacterota bacterium]HRZ54870.1 magnesium transporter [Candidatus Paceibacterota bacterium]